jgi:hypothetical protein
LTQSQGGTELQPADILKYFEELKRGSNTEFGTKDIFEMASKYSVLREAGLDLVSEKEVLLYAPLYQCDHPFV